MPWIEPRDPTGNETQRVTVKRNTTHESIAWVEKNTWGDTPENCTREGIRPPIPRKARFHDWAKTAHGTSAWKIAPSALTSASPRSMLNEVRAVFEVSAFTGSFTADIGELLGAVRAVRDRRRGRRRLRLRHCRFLPRVQRHGFRVRGSVLVFLHRCLVPW